MDNTKLREYIKHSLENHSSLCTAGHANLALEEIMSKIAEYDNEIRIDELVETYNNNFIHWGDNLERAKFAIQKRISYLKQKRGGL